jgi:SH3-like domain-containing protein
MSRLWLIGLVLLCAFTPAPLGSGPGPAVGSNTGLAVPRFVSLRSGEVNFRAGPGFSYPVTWIYHREGLPVEIVAEFDVWRQVVAPDGGTGWVHASTLRARRGFIITSDLAILRADTAANAAPVAYLKKGVSGVLISCDGVSDFCKASVQGEKGFLTREDFWGVFAGEVVK